MQIGLLGHDFFGNYDVKIKKDVVEFYVRWKWADSETDFCSTHLKLFAAESKLFNLFLEA